MPSKRKYMAQINDLDRFYADLGDKIKKQRVRKGYNQEDLGKYLGLTRTSIVNIEKGRQRPPVHTLYELANFLNIGIRELFPIVEKKHQVDFMKALREEDINNAGEKFGDIPVNKNKEKIAHFFQLSDPK